MQVHLASMMVCRSPSYLKGRLYLSASDSVWTPVEHLDESLHRYFTDELGNASVKYGGFLQMVDPAVLGTFAAKELYACFRGVEKSLLGYIQAYPPEDIFENLSDHLKFMGWDISTGNGWLSASCHGCFPVDPATGDEIDENAWQINKFGLFEHFSDCIMYCEKNNNKIPEHAPWYPVAVFVDDDSCNRLKKYLEEKINGRSR